MADDGILLAVPTDRACVYAVSVWNAAKIMVPSRPSCDVQQVTEDDILMEMEGVEERDDSDFDRGILVTPRVVHPTAENCCVICLESYQPGESVVWSTNVDCEHVFHRDCIVKYFDKIQRRVASTPCPCCRSPFTSMTVEIRAQRRQRRVRTLTAPSTIVSSVHIPWFR